MPHVRPQSVVDSALRCSDKGMRDADNAALHGVAVKTIRRWRRLYQRRGEPRAQGHLAPPCPRCDGAPLADQAYAELLGGYLGDGHISRGRRDVHNLHVINDRILEEWQAEVVRAFPADFLRGLFHSDGCRVDNWATRVVGGKKKRYDYPKWQFVNASEDILGLCTWALDLAEVPWRRSGARVVSVSRRDAVARLEGSSARRHDQRGRRYAGAAPSIASPMRWIRSALVEPGMPGGLPAMITTRSPFWTRPMSSRASST